MITSTIYNQAFWNSIKTNGKYSPELKEGINNYNGDYFMPSESFKKYTAALSKENLFRKYATVKNATMGDSTIWITSSTAKSEWIDEFGEIPVIPLDPDSIKVSSYKLANISVLKTDFAKDTNLDIESYLTDEFALRFGRAEEDTFINGDGVNKPTGILHETNGAETGVTVNSSIITFDDVIKLFFSVKSEYRTNAIWVMNDETAQYLYSLKDNDGNYLWRGSADTLLGKPVVISNHMPSAENGKKPIAFGDFRYYWIVQRQLLSVKVLTEKYTVNGEVGYMGFERLDGKLVKKEAIKILKVVE